MHNLEWSAIIQKQIYLDYTLLMTQFVSVQTKLKILIISELINVFANNPIIIDVLLLGSEILSEESNREIFYLVESFILECGRFVT